MIITLNPKKTKEELIEIVKFKFTYEVGSLSQLA